MRQFVPANATGSGRRFRLLAAALPVGSRCDYAENGHQNEDLHWSLHRFRRDPPVRPRDFDGPFGANNVPTVGKC
jgi:hypothetical protein